MKIENDCSVYTERPKELREGLLVLAEWFDAVYDDAKDGKNQVQQDLRRWADEYTRLEKLNGEFDSKNAELLARIAELESNTKTVKFAWTCRNWNCGKINSWEWWIEDFRGWPMELECEHCGKLSKNMPEPEVIK